MSKVVRSVKNVTKGYSSVEIKVRNATSNDPWGPVGSDMAEIAQLTFNNSQDFYQIMDMLDKRLNDKGKNWRHVLKSLKVLDYCLHEGSELVVTWARKNLYIIKTLREFQYVDEDGRDVGQNVRVSAKELTSLILDEERLRAERADRKSWKSRVTGLDDYGTGGAHGGADATRPRQQRRQRNEEEDLEYKLAIEASKNEMEEERKRRERHARTEDDEDLQKAIRLSQEEEELRRRELEETNANSLFDDTPAQPAIAQPTGWNQGYQQQGAVDWFGNLVDQQQPQNTGFLNSAYSQPTGMQPQQTGFQNGYGYGGFQQPQPTGFDAYGQQQNYLQPQQTAFNMGNNPWGQQNGFAQQQPLEQQNTLQPGSNNPWASSSGAHTTDSIKPMPTGSNNPFASAITRPATAQPVRSTAPSLSTLQEQSTAQFNGNNSGFNPIRDFSAPPTQSFQSQSPQKEQPMDPHAARLNALLASGEGQDTFGNIGNLRIPAQHTAPGTFVNSAGAGAARLTQNATGNNPFLNSQFTGMPQQTGFANQNRLMPAQTGPVGGFGGNPFGGASFGQQQQQQQQQGSLIDL
ncbi:Epsin-1 [Lasiodiplodia theobromae]|uniref:Epsin-1 n=1 Tax=Lasiodiplodia theobromae TaxID=45133 RepID=A0A5N5DCT1_9PEZI|nr:Epsin-1 [Lasiodiplodia theobromae]